MTLKVVGERVGEGANDPLAGVLMLECREIGVKQAVSLVDGDTDRTAVYTFLGFLSMIC